MAVDETARRLEGEISAGNLSRAKDYVEQAIRLYIKDVAELERRKKYLARRCEGDEGCVFYWGILCVLTNDRPGWDIVARFLGDNMDPSLGYHSFRFLNAQTSDNERLEAWKFLIEDSAARGHIQSRNFVFDKDVARIGFLKWPVILAQRIWIGIVFLFLYVRNPRDPRLPIVGSAHESVRSSV